MRWRLGWIAMAAGCKDDPVDRVPPDDDVDGCRAEAPDPDRARAVLVSRPYTEDASASPLWAVHELDEAGALHDASATLSLGRGNGGTVAFSPDGTLAITVHDDGTIGIVALDGLDATVVEPAWDGGFYAVDAWFDPSGERAFVVDGNWVENGGGVYEVALDCATGEPELVGKVLDSKLGRALLDVGGLTTLVADAAVAVVDLDAGTSEGAVPLFDYPDAIVAGVAAVGDDWLLVGDYSEFSGVPNRVVAVAMSRVPTVVSEIEILDPIAIGASPSSDEAIVLSGYGDEIIGLVRGTDGWVTGDRVGSELPGAVAVVRDGPNAGLALVVEVSGIRSVRFDGAGGLDDGGRLDTGDGIAHIPGSIGIQP